MKIALFYITTLAVLISSCNENSVQKTESGFESVESYIQHLKANQFQEDKLPAFTYDDIPYLLEYRNESQIITDYPRNLISSYYQPECALGMYVLWTIESIRAVSINSPYLMQRFPSQNPILALRNSDELKLVQADSAHTVAANAYYDWWMENQNKNFNTFKNIDPLKNTDYRWH